MKAITELKNQVAEISIDMTEKILRKELDNSDKHKKLVSTILKDIN